jgi:hypothetical protein
MPACKNPYATRRRRRKVEKMAYVRYTDCRARPFTANDHLASGQARTKTAPIILKTTWTSETTMNNCKLEMKIYNYPIIDKSEVVSE